MESNELEATNNSDTQEKTDGINCPTCGHLNGNWRSTCEKCNNSLRLKSAVKTQKSTVEKGFRNGAQWFYWIAALSLINAIIFNSGGEWYFLIGLGATYVFEGIFASLVIASIFAAFGYFALNRKYWAFIIGIILYAIDALLLLSVPDFPSVIFHGIGLFGIIRGVIHLRTLEKLEKSVENNDYAGQQKILDRAETSRQRELNKPKRFNTFLKIIAIGLVGFAIWMCFLLFVVPNFL